MKKRKHSIYMAFLRSAVMAALLLIGLAVFNLLYIKTAEKQGDSVQDAASASAQTSSDDSGLYAENPASENGRLPKSSVSDGSGLLKNSVSDDSGLPKNSASGNSQPSTGEGSSNVNQPAGGAAAGNAAMDAAANADNAKNISKDTTLIFAGDIYLSDYVLANYNQSGIQGVLAESMLAELTQADITMVNNEFPYSTRGTQAPDKQFTFRIDPSYVSLLQEAGVDIVTLANNHVLDYGADALTDTFQTLDRAGIAYAGAGDSLERACRLVTKTANGRTFGFLAASRVFPVVSWNVENAQPGVFSAYDPAKLVEAVKAAQTRCDFLCVYVHWGIERSETPEDYQISMAHALIDAGADAVIGAHPHVLQGVEYYKEKPVFYSLGNFIFYQSIEKTAAAKLTLAADGTASWQLLMAKASDACTSLVADDAARRNFYEYMAALSTNVVFSEDGVIEMK